MDSRWESTPGAGGVGYETGQKQIFAMEKAGGHPH